MNDPKPPGRDAPAADHRAFAKKLLASDAYTTKPDDMPDTDAVPDDEYEPDEEDES